MNVLKLKALIRTRVSIKQSRETSVYYTNLYQGITVTTIYLSVKHFDAKIGGADLHPKRATWKPVKLSNF